jgi:spore maturation protein CgeB
MRIAILTTSYPQFLRRLYLDNPGLESKSYSEQLAARNESFFALADFYSRGFRAHGHEAVEFHLNNPWLQHAWMREQGYAVEAPPPAANGAANAVSGTGMTGQARALLRPLLRPILRRFVPPPMPDWQFRILRAQIEHYRPDVIYNQEPAAVPDSFLEEMRAPGRLIIAQIASARPPWHDFRVYDLVVSSLPNFVAHFRARDVPSAYNRLAFEPSVYQQIGPQLRDIPLSFVGSVAPVHKNRLALLEYVAERLPLMMWGNDIERLPPSSPLHRCYQGEAWGRTMFEILGRSQITLNNHEAVSGIYANNLRLYEASGMGALQLIDRKSDLHEIYLPGEEVMAFDSLEDAVRQAEHMMVDAATRERIAAAGQRRAFDSHSYFRRVGELLEIFDGVCRGEARSRWL